jgi:ubiquinone/menaquinone biosynthesis C-methylase UbiE
MVAQAHSKGYKGIPLEGPLARWYARTTGREMGEFRRLAEEIAGQVADGGSVLEVAPGPGYLAIELARLGRQRIVGLDISHSFVRMATESAKAAGVEVTFRQGDAAAMPLGGATFDFIICRAAFKNFTQPAQALNEMHRVLRPGGKTVIIDMRRDASTDAIRREVDRMRLGPLASFMTTCALLTLRRRAYSPPQFRQMASETPFRACEIRTEGIGMELSLTK